jgi:outer membrane protein OmpA-like peptidoglycan-associated protein
MNTINPRGVMLRKTLIAATVASVLLAACAAAPVKPDGAAEARSKLTQLQSDPNLAGRAPVAVKEADAAVQAAEQPQADQELGAYKVYLADRKVEIARAQAETSFAEDQRAALSAQREGARLVARTQEADTAHLAAATSAQQAAELQRQIDALQAKPTDRGLIVTLGDVLFDTGRANLKPGATSNLNRLVTFLNQYPDRTVRIEGYTDSVGGEDYNQGLSERRADSVKSYLAGQGIGSIRLSASGKGESDPVASNDSAAGREQNRRVEVIISNPPASNPPAAALR